MKKWAILFVFCILLSPKGWGGELLELSDAEKLNKSYSRVLNNLRDFYRVNAPQIKVLNDEGFFSCEDYNLNVCGSALQQIRENQNSIIVQYYGVAPSGINKLRKDLIKIKDYLSSEEGQEAETIVTFAQGILLILEFFDL